MTPERMEILFDPRVPFVAPERRSTRGDRMEALLDVTRPGEKQMRITNDLVVDDHEITERFV